MLAPKIPPILSCRNQLNQTKTGTRAASTKLKCGNCYVSFRNISTHSWQDVASEISQRSGGALCDEIGFETSFFSQRFFALGLSFKLLVFSFQDPGIELQAGLMKPCHRT